MSAPRDVVAGDLRAWWFGSIHEISDAALQRRMWLDPMNRNPHWSYIEFVCSYPADDQLQHAFREGWLGADEFAIMSDMRKALEAYTPPDSDHYDNAAILDDPNWRSVVEAAGHAKRLLVSHPISERERVALIGEPG